MQNVTDSLAAVESEQRHQDQAQSLPHVTSHKSATGLEEGLNNARGSTDAAVVADQPIAIIEADARGPLVRAGDTPQSHTMLAFCSAVFCFWPFGFVALCYAARVEGMVRTGDLEGARRSSRRALQWSFISVVTGVFELLFMFAPRTMRRMLS